MFVNKTKEEDKKPAKKKVGLIRVHHGQYAHDARVVARVKYIEELDKQDRRHLVTDSAIERWYGPRILRDRETTIAKEFGKAESIWLQRD